MIQTYKMNTYIFPWLKQFELISYLNIFKHYQPTKTRYLSILFLYYSYSSICKSFFLFLKNLPPSKEGHLCGCGALVSACPALGVSAPTLGYDPHQV